MNSGQYILLLLSCGSSPAAEPVSDWQDTKKRVFNNQGPGGEQVCSDKEAHTERAGMTEQCLLKTGRVHKLTYSDPAECINVMVRVHLIKTVTCFPAFFSDTSWNATRIARPNGPTPTNSEEFILLKKQFINTTFSLVFFPVRQRKQFILGEHRYAVFKHKFEHLSRPASRS